MTSAILKWLIIAAATINYGFMTFDGIRALTVGDYIRPKTGEYAGQLGPWSGLVEKVGIDPESTGMKMIFVVYGLMGLAFAIAFAMNASWSWTAMLVVSIGSLWYLMPGTVLSVVQIGLLVGVWFVSNN